MTDFLETLRSVQSGRSTEARDQIADQPQRRDTSRQTPATSPELAADLVDLIVLVDGDDPRTPREVANYVEYALSQDRPAWSAAARSLGALWSLRQGDDEAALEAMVSAEHELALEAALPPLDAPGQPTGIGAATNNMGVLFLLMHLFELAEPHLQRAAEESRRYAAPYQAQLCADLANLAELYFRCALEAEACQHRGEAQRHAQACADAAAEMCLHADAQQWPEAQRFARILQIAAESLTDPSAVTGESVTEVSDLIEAGTMGGTGTMAIALAAQARVCRLAGDSAGAARAASQASLLGIDDLMIDAAWREAAMAMDPQGGPGFRYGEARSQRLERRRVAAVRDFRRRLSLAQLRRRNRTLAKRTERDPLTGVGNRSMLERLNGDPRYAGAGLILLDVDRFKVVNDCYGHPAGDKVLELVAHIAVTEVGDAGAVIRLGGDEFAVLVRDADAATLHRVSRAIVHGVAHRRNSTDLPAATVSAGFAVGADEEVIMDLLAEADRSLYDAKREGGSRVRPDNPSLDGAIWPDCDQCLAARR